MQTIFQEYAMFRIGRPILSTVLYFCRQMNEPIADENDSWKTVAIFLAGAMEGGRTGGESLILNCALPPQPPPTPATQTPTRTPAPTHTHDDDHICDFFCARLRSVAFLVCVFFAAACARSIKTRNREKSRDDKKTLKSSPRTRNQKSGNGNKNERLFDPLFLSFFLSFSSPHGRTSMRAQESKHENVRAEGRPKTKVRWLRASLHGAYMKHKGAIVSEVEFDTEACEIE